MVEAVASAASAASRAVDPESARARRTAEEFESIFIAEMLRPIFETLTEQASLGGGAGERLMAPMLTDAYAQAMAGAGGIGIADTIYDEILALQGVKP